MAFTKDVFKQEEIYNRKVRDTAKRIFKIIKVTHQLRQGDIENDPAFSFPVVGLAFNYLSTKGLIQKYDEHNPRVYKITKEGLNFSGFTSEKIKIFMERYYLLVVIISFIAGTILSPLISKWLEIKWLQQPIQQKQSPR